MNIPKPNPKRIRAARFLRTLHRMHKNCPGCHKDLAKRNQEFIREAEIFMRIPHKMEPNSMFKCEKCNKETERLQIAWGESGGEKVDVLDYWCPSCGNTGGYGKPKLVFLGTEKEREKYWKDEWNGELDTDL